MGETTAISKKNIKDDRIELDFSERAYLERYNSAKERIENMPGDGDIPERYKDYFHVLSVFVLTALEIYEEPSLVREQGKLFNERLFSDVSEENYERSYADYDYAVSKTDPERGPLLSMFYVELRGLAGFVYERKLKDITVLLETFIQIYNLFENDELPSEKELRDTLYSYVYDYCAEFVYDEVSEGLSGERGFAENIVMNADLSNPEYLYAFGERITDSELRTAEYMAGLSDEKVKLMADAYTGGFIEGFSVAGKDISKKSTVRLYMPLGYERMFREAIKNFRASGLSPVIARRPLHLINKKLSGNVRAGFYGHINRSLEHDHKNDLAFFQGDRLMEHKLEALRNAYEKHREQSALFAGPACVETFGEDGFTPENKRYTPEFSEYQKKLNVKYQASASLIAEKYMPEEETSYTIIAWPRPEIEDRFSEIFDEIIKINTLPKEEYGKMQQALIDALDKAEYVRIKGFNGNATDMRVKLHEITDEAAQTCFENCLADMNIPLGEVFTSPVLKGTDGILNVSSVYLGEYLFKDLKIEFKDGRVVSYGCKNFPEEEENKRYIEEAIFKNRKNLPLGEFAIGTNTAAYAAGRKFGIMKKLPILIMEKTGPHFAVGDTCYSHAEDFKVYNPDGKEIIARSNECADMRNEAPEKAYFNVHCDITIPYDETGEITAVSKDGKRTEIIRDGRFVLPGTEELNAPLGKF